MSSSLPLNTFIFLILYVHFVFGREPEVEYIQLLNTHPLSLVQHVPGSKKRKC